MAVVALTAFFIGFVALPLAAVWLLTVALIRRLEVRSSAGRAALGVLLFLLVFIGLVTPTATMASDDYCLGRESPVVPEGTHIASRPSLWPPGKLCRFVKPNGEVVIVRPGYWGLALLLLDAAVVPLAAMEWRSRRDSPRPAEPAPSRRSTSLS